MCTVEPTVERQLGSAGGLASPCVPVSRPCRWQQRHMVSVRWQGAERFPFGGSVSSRWGAAFQSPPKMDAAFMAITCAGTPGFLKTISFLSFYIFLIIKDDLEDIKLVEHGLNETIHIRGGVFS